MRNWPKIIGKRPGGFPGSVIMGTRPARYALLLAFCLLSLLGAGCAEEIPPPPAVASPTPPPVLNIGLASSAAPVADLVSVAVEASIGVPVNFVQGNNATLFADLAEGTLDALLVHYLPPDSSQWYNPVAMDALVIVVHAENPVQTLARAEVQALFSGRVDNWRDLGGAERPVALIGRERGAGVRRLFAQQVMAEQRTSINTIIQPDPVALLAAVAAEPGAIGYAMMGAAAGEEGIALVAVDGVPPTPNSAGTQNYPLAAPLYFVSPAEPAGPGSGGALRAFLAWLQSDEGQLNLNEKYGRVR